MPVLIIDEHLGPADYVARCRHCDQAYLLELVDLKHSVRAYRYAVLGADHADRFIHNMTRGTCDLSRASAEVHNLATLHSFADGLVIADVRSNQILDCPAAKGVPTTSWRNLPCDGSWCRTQAAS
jgi:hypothetical protein